MSTTAPICSFSARERATAAALADDHRRVERSFFAARQAAWDFYKGERKTVQITLCHAVFRVQVATQALQMAREAAGPLARAQYQAFRAGVEDVASRLVLDLFSSDDDELRAIAESVAAEWTDYGVRLCDGTYVSAGPRVTRGGTPIRWSAELFRHYPPGDPRKPRADRVR